MNRWVALGISLLYSMIANAAWQCPAIDKFGKMYSVTSPYIKVSVYKSLDRCKKYSNDPVSCIVERAFCHRIANSGISKTHWLCYSFDNHNIRYPSGPYTNKYQAAYAAESICRRLSKVPSTCYVRPFTCEKI